MHAPARVRVTVVSPEIVEKNATRGGQCCLRVESTDPLPRAVYNGTMRITGKEAGRSGMFACRMLKHFSVEFLKEDGSGAVYSAWVDLSDEVVKSGGAYAPPGLGTRTPDEPHEVVFKRIAGIFGRYCEGYRPPTVTVSIEE